MQRYFVKEDQIHNGEVTIVGDDCHHMTNVMRVKLGDPFICSDGQGNEAIATIVHIDPTFVRAQLTELRKAEGEPNVDVFVAQSLPKGDKMESVIRQCTEIGALAFYPFQSQRTIVQYDAKKQVKRTQRWQKIAKEAAEQAHRGRIPHVHDVLTWKELLKQMERMDFVIICYEQENQLGLRTALQKIVRERVDSLETSRLHILLIIGPEGGFEQVEVKEAERAGAIAIHLGKRILRTETAALVALSCLLYEMNEMGD